MNNSLEDEGEEEGVASSKTKEKGEREEEEEAKNDYNNEMITSYSPLSDDHGSEDQSPRDKGMREHNNNNININNINKTRNGTSTPSAMDTTGGESSSTDSTNGKGNSSGSGTDGYSADCSGSDQASDQSSDEGGNKTKASGANSVPASGEDNKAGSSPNELPMNQLGISTRRENETSDSSDLVLGSTAIISGNRDNDTHDRNKASTSREMEGAQSNQARVGERDHHHTHRHHHHRHHHKAKSGDTSHNPSRKTSRTLLELTEEDGEGNLPLHQQRTGNASSSTFMVPSLPFKSPEMIDIDGILKSRVQLDLDNANFWMGSGAAAAAAAVAVASSEFATKQQQRQEQQQQQDNENDDNDNGNAKPPSSSSTPASAMAAAAAAAAAAWWPQWNGIRVGNPMDPRIDLSKVSVIPGEDAVFPLPLPPLPNRYCSDNNNNNNSNETSKPAATITSNSQEPQEQQPKTIPASITGSHEQQQEPEQRMDSTTSPPTNTGPEANASASVDSYIQLMEMVRPFFMSHGILLANQLMQQQAQQQQHQAQAQTQQASEQAATNKTQQQVDSSEGFTSFFTTTHSSQQSGSSSGEGGKATSQQHTLQQHQNQQHGDPEKKDHNREEEGDDGDDTIRSDSSMVVLARTKRKHLKAKSCSEEASSSSTPSSGAGAGERRVRIQEEKTRQGSLADQKEEEDCSNSLQNAEAQPGQRPPLDRRAAAEESPESSGSSSSATPLLPVAAAAAAGDAPRRLHQHHHGAVPPSIVTDISSSARTDSTGPNGSSGSGSTGNTGSGSNQGSSGSGNEAGEGGKAGSSEEGKGGSSNEEHVEQGGGQNKMEEDASDQSGINNNKSEAVAVKPTTEHHHHPHHHHHQSINHNAGQHTAVTGLSGDTGADATARENKEAVRERKLLDKKRKRIEMRREYEAQQHDFESSISSDHKPEVLFQPGKPITFDQVLQCSKIPRIVIKSTVPFLVVHANAAFARLTGIDSHKVVGKPISYVLSLPNEMLGSSDIHNEQASTYAAAPDTAAGRQRTNNHRGTRRHGPRHQDTLERLVAASGYGRLHLVHVASKRSQLVGKSVAFHKERPSSVAQSVSGGRHREERAAPVAPDHQLIIRAAKDHSVSSDTSTCKQALSCRASIAPIVSEVSGLSHDSHAVGDDENESKRRKLSPSVESSTGTTGPARRGVSAGTSHEEKESSSVTKRRKLQSATTESLGTRGSMMAAIKEQQQQVIAHFVIQLELGDRKHQQHVGSVESLSSHSISVEAQLLNTSKQEALHERAVTRGIDQSGGYDNTHLEPNIAVRMGADEDEVASESTNTPVEPVSTVG